jgi:carnitine 3-dehydrogenase
VPLVEIVGGADADPAALEWLDGFYRRVGKSPITLNKEIEAYVANRLQRVLLEEGARLVADGVCSWMDVELAVTKGPGFRWPIQGPVLHRHLGGGAGGVRQMLAHFGWNAAPETKDAFIDTVDRRWGHVPMDELEDWRDQNMLRLLRDLEEAP